MDKLKDISIEEQAEYLRIALALQHIGINVEMAERIVRTYKKMEELGENFSVKDAVKIDSELTKKFLESSQLAKKS